MNSDSVAAVFVIILVTVCSILTLVLTLTGTIKPNRCDPYYSGGELVSDCSAAEARAELEP